MTITLGICLVFRIQFRDFLTEMAFRDAALDIPIVDYIFNVNNGKKMMQLKKLVVESQKDLLNYTSLLLKIYVTGVWLCATLYLCSPIYSMLVSEDKSLRLLGKYFEYIFNSIKNNTSKYY